MRAGRGDETKYSRWIGRVRFSTLTWWAADCCQMTGSILPMKIETVEEVLVEELKDLYDAEKQLLKAMPKLAETASSPTLRMALSNYREEAEDQLERLREVFSAIGVK